MRTRDTKLSFILRYMNSFITVIEPGRIKVDGHAWCCDDISHTLFVMDFFDEVVKNEFMQRAILDLGYARPPSCTSK